MSYKKEKTLNNLPYTVVSHTSTPDPRLSILLTAEGIKAIAKKTKKGDLIRIERWADVTEECNKKTHYGRITVIKKEVK